MPLAGGSSGGLTPQGGCVDDVAQQLPGLHATVEETLAALATLH